MILRSIFLFAICLHVGLTANLQRQELSIPECAAKVGECDESKGRPVCGTDGQTYPTRCHLLRVQCSGHQVSIRYRGLCKACNVAREYALKHRTKNPLKFIPRCKKDGTYAPIQCLTNSGCWCSDITGTPIDNTTVRTVGRLKCREFTKAYTRRSPSRNASGNKKRSCSQDDRATFNTNLIGLFHSEYLRVGFQLNKNRKTDALVPTLDETEVLNWKFSDLDVNNNQMLDKNEFRELKKLVKRAVKPRRCGRAFGKFCDVDSDARLSRLEWNNCLSKDGINRHLINMGQKHNNTKKHRKNNHHLLHTNTAYRHSSASASASSTNQHQNQHSIQDNNHSHLDHNQNSNPNPNHFNILHHNNNNHQNRLRPDSYENESNPADDEDDDDNSSHTADYTDDYEDVDDDHMASINSPTKFPSINILSTSASVNTKSKDNEPDYAACFADRKDALTQNEENLKNGKKVGHVPICTPDGRFQRVQCYNSICWCADEETGETLNGTSVKNRVPQCGAVTRAMKGCPNEVKVVFLKDLKEFLKTKIIAGSNEGTNTTQWKSEDERIATLSFVILDKNKNKSWERKEWKTFRELVTNNRTLRRCGRKMPRYCDVNSDKKVTLSEWLSCLQTHRVEQNTQPDFKPPIHMLSNDTTFAKPPKLNGTNPLTIYLT
ncbi:hypothetical protein FF38_03205 [Lucilia cuprina]|uniref:SPARC-related modular calcium-binding protein 2 n=1 Tax=Lucilia cuprina TaxID=7375 RepID=A0A0L0BPC6_LUCCU|nr:SPARC-related modular calcium-binding protein 1 [Lucilia cuprina]KNC21838.1 hypothetical protein FF38_03205 [Lucilia cuprina]